MKEGVILIPARYESSRFPGKPLVPLLGRPLIEWARGHAAQTGIRTIVVTDHAGIEETVRSHGGEVLRVDDPVASGTERIHLAVTRHLGKESPQWVLNVQGDEPMLEASELCALVEFHQRHQFDLCTLVRPRQDQQGLSNPNLVKVIYSRESGECHYFSRAPIPFNRDAQEKVLWYQHVGVYLYRWPALKKFCQSSVSFYEDIEKLEQLRALELGMKIGAHMTRAASQGVDTPSDLKAVERLLQGEKRGQEH